VIWSIVIAGNTWLVPIRIVIPIGCSLFAPITLFAGIMASPAGAGRFGMD